MVRGLALAGQAQHLRAEFTQVALDLLLLRALDVVLGGVLQVSLDLAQEEQKSRALRLDQIILEALLSAEKKCKNPLVLSVRLLK